MRLRLVTSVIDASDVVGEAVHLTCLNIHWRQA